MPAGLVNCTYIDWFLEWPADALREVAGRQLEAEDVGDPATKQAICEVLIKCWHEKLTANAALLQKCRI